MNKKISIDGLTIGSKALRKKDSHGTIEWIEFTINETYLPLMAEFPKDYRHINGGEINPHGWAVGKVKCDICSHEWIGVRPSNQTKLECPNCKQVAHFEEIGV